jgi:AcrR family transcriptional regulator
MSGSRGLGGSGAGLVEGSGDGLGTASREAVALFPRLKPGPKRSPSAASAHQRTRLHAATIEACDRKGYAATTAAEIATLAGVSKKTLYQHFGSKDACFLATYDMVVCGAVARISAAYRGDGCGGERDPAAGLCRAFDAFAVELVDRPAAPRVALVDILAVAPSAMDRIERAEATFVTMIAGSLGQGAEGVAVPGGMVRALIGGVWFVARNRLSEGRPEAIAASGAELGEWLLAYRSAAAAIVPAAPLGRPAPEGGERRPDPAAAEQGQMLEWLSADALAEALRQSEGAPTWGSSVCRVVEALFRRIASDPELARAAFLDAFAAGQVVAERRAAIMRGFANVLAQRAPVGGVPSPVVAEAIVGSVWSIAHRYVAGGRQKMLPVAWPRAAFVAMAPIIGAEEALAAIRAEGARPSQSGNSGFEDSSVSRYFP